MTVFSRSLLGLFLLLTVCRAELGAQDGGIDPHVQPASLRLASQGELDRREALKRYGLGLYHERSNRLVEAARDFEEAVRLDPGATPVYRALVPLYVALERTADALAACRKALELDPGDFETLYFSAQLHKSQGQAQAAIAALEKSLACPSLRDQPELYIQIACDLAVAQEGQRNIEGALVAFHKVARALENTTPLVEQGTMTREECSAKAAEIHERIGMLCLETKKYEQAASAFIQAQKKDPEMAGRLNFHLARTRFAQEKWEDSLRYLKVYLGTQPRGIEAYELAIVLQGRLGQDANILPMLRDYAKRDAHNLALQRLLARRYVEEQQWNEAETLYEWIAREEPGPEIYRGLFDLYQAQARALAKEGRAEEAQEKLSLVLGHLDRAVLKANPTNDDAPDASAVVRVRAMLSILRDDAGLVKALLPIALGELAHRRERSRDTWRYLAVLAGRTHQLADAERLYQQCLENVTPQTEQEIYVGYLQVLWEGHKLEEIVKLCKKGLKETQASNRLIFHDNLPRALAQLGRIDEALAEATKAVDSSNDENRLHFRLTRVKVLALGDRFEEAATDGVALLKELSRQEGAAPEDVRHVRYTLSSIYSSAHQLDKAEELLRLILETDPNDESANNDLGYIMADQGKNFEEAERLIRKAIELDREQKRRTSAPPADAKERADKSKKKFRAGTDDDKDHAAYIDSLGWVLFRRGRFAEARQELEKAVALPDGNDPVIWDHLGDVYLRLNDTAKAQNAWRKSLQLYEVEKKRKQDDQYQELKRKLKLVSRE